jgi:hypothetical protein
VQSTPLLLRPKLSLSGDVVGRYFDRASARRFIVARPSSQPELWERYLNGARASYRRHGVETAVEYDEVRDGKSTTLFFAAVERDGRVAGGMRVQGPYVRAEQAHAVEEWAGREGASQLYREISERIPDGVVEMKAGWVDDDAVRRRELTSALARIFVHSMNLMQVRYALCTVASHAVPRWATTGGVVSSKIAAVPYPDDRYETVPMWWDRHTFANLAARDQLSAILDESDQLFDRSWQGQAEVPLVA